LKLKKNPKNLMAEENVENENGNKQGRRSLIENDCASKSIFNIDIGEETKANVENENDKQGCCSLVEFDCSSKIIFDKEKRVEFLEVMRKSESIPEAKKATRLDRLNYVIKNQWDESSSSWKFNTMLAPYNLYIIYTFRPGAHQNSNSDGTIVDTMFWWGVLPFLVWICEGFARYSLGSIVCVTSTATSAIMNCIMILIGSMIYVNLRNSVDDLVLNDINQLPSKIALGALEIFGSIVVLLIFAFLPIDMFNYIVETCIVKKNEKEIWIELWEESEKELDTCSLFVFIFVVIRIALRALISLFVALVSFVCNVNVNKV
jgi:hypothetical protein